MLRKFAIAMIATTMLVAPALAADAVKSAPAAAVPATLAATATAPAATPGQSTAATTDVKTGKDVKKIKVVHGRNLHHLAVSKHGKSLVKIAKHSTHVKTAKVVKPTAPAPTATPATVIQNPVVPGTTVSTNEPSKTNVKTIKAEKPVKKLKVSHRLNGHKLAMVKHGKVKIAKHSTSVKTANASKPVKPVDPSKTKTHEAKSNTKANVN